MLLHQLRHNVLLETSEARVQHIQRHLAAIEVEIVLRREIQHSQVNHGILVPCKADETDLARLLRLFQRLPRPTWGKETVRILQADVLVELHQVDMVGLQPLQRLVDLPRRRVLGAAVKLRH